MCERGSVRNKTTKTTKKLCVCVFLKSVCSSVFYLFLLYLSLHSCLLSHSSSSLTVSFFYSITIFTTNRFGAKNVELLERKMCVCVFKARQGAEHDAEYGRV